MRIARLIAALAVLCAAGFTPLSAQDFKSRAGDFGISANFWVSGSISLHEWGTTVTKNGSPLVRIFYDNYLIEKLAMGLFVNYSPATVGTSSMTANTIDIGLTIKPRFIVADGGAAIKPGLNIGYRTTTSDNANIDATDAMALNASVEIQFSPASQLMPFIEIGFLAQPVGGNDITGVSFAPIFYVGGGVVF